MCWYNICSVVAMISSCCICCHVGYHGSTIGCHYIGLPWCHLVAFVVLILGCRDIYHLDVCVIISLGCQWHHLVVKSMGSHGVFVLLSSPWLAMALCCCQVLRLPWIYLDVMSLGCHIIMLSNPLGSHGTFLLSSPSGAISSSCCNDLGCHGIILLSWPWLPWHYLVAMTLVVMNAIPFYFAVV